MIRDPACSASLIAAAHVACLRAGLLSELPRCLGESQRAAAPLRASGWRTRLEAEDLLDPGRQRVGGEGRELFRRRGITDTPTQCVRGDSSRIGDPLQRLPDDMAGLDRHTEQGGRHLGDRPPLIAGVALRGHRGRGADALNSRRVAGVPEPADEQGHVGALAAAVSVQLVQDQEPQAPRRLDQAPVPGPGQDQFQHHVVGQQDVGRIRDDPGPVIRGLLPGITIEGHRRALADSRSSGTSAAPSAGCWPGRSSGRRRSP